MMCLRGVWLIVAMIAISTYACDESKSDAAHAQHEESLLRGVRWVLSQQRPDGGWRSETYGVMQCGVGNTALIVATLTEILDQLPANTRDEVSRARQRGIEFLTRYQHPTGFVHSPEGETDFPVYSTALLLKSLQAGDRVKETLKSTLSNALRGSQRVKRNGFSRETLNYGGWGMLDVADDSGVNPATVSTTSFVLEALSASGELTHEVREDALIFLNRCQQDDGGFCFTPNALDPLNKAGLLPNTSETAHARSYLSATCDGWIALRTCGHELANEKSLAATHWLEKQKTYREDLPSEEQEILSGLRFYEGARLSQLAKNLPQTSPVHIELTTLTKQLIRDQHPDGYWLNTNITMREDDPLIATAFALQAL